METLESLSALVIASEVMLAVAVAVLSGSLVVLARRVRALEAQTRRPPIAAFVPPPARRRDEGPPLASRLRSLLTTDADGEPRVMGAAGAAELILFVTPGCPRAGSILRALDLLAEAADMSPIVVCDGDPAGLAGRGGLRAPVVSDPEVLRVYRAPAGRPFALATDRDGVLRAKGVVQTPQEVAAVAETALRRAIAAARLRRSD